jgi:hypothetical protein
MLRLIGYGAIFIALSGAAQTALAESEPPPAGGLGQGNLLNPAITAFLDLGGSLSTNQHDDRYNRFNLREAELDLRAAVTPSADAALILAVGEEIEQQAGEVEVDTVFELEEGYLNLHTLPWGLSLKGGKLRNAFGRNNLLHTHDLPQVTRPLAVEAFLGPEGLGTVGASISWIVPNPWDQYLELVVEVVNDDGGEESPILGGAEGENPAVVSHLRFFRDVGEASSLELGGSFLFGRPTADNDSRAYLAGLDAGFHWRDPRKPDSRSLLLQAEAFSASSDSEDSQERLRRNRSLGLYVFGQVQLARDWYTGVRYDHTQHPDLGVHDTDDRDWGLSSWLTWYLFEFLKLRLEYQHRSFEQFGDRDRDHNAILGGDFAIGAHPPHPYWVNR